MMTIALMRRLPIYPRFACDAILMGALAILLAGLAGCFSLGRGVDVVVRPQFLTYDRVALWSSLARETEDLFIPLYMDAFPAQTLVERRDVSAITGEQDILPERLDEETRAKLRKILGVKAIVYPSVTKEGFAIKVIETDTGAISASVFVDGESRTDGTPVKTLVRRAISSLRAKAETAREEYVPPVASPQPVRPPPRD